MEDILRKLYNSSTARKPSSQEYLRVKHHTTDFSDQLIEKLEQLGVEDANDLIMLDKCIVFFYNRKTASQFLKGFAIIFNLVMNYMKKNRNLE